MSGTGIGELPPIVLPELLKKGELVEVMPSWHFEAVDLSIVYLGTRHLTKALRLFKEFTIQVAPTMFSELPT